MKIGSGGLGAWCRIKSGPQWEPFLSLVIYEILISELIQKVLKNTSFVKKWKNRHSYYMNRLKSEIDSRRRSPPVPLSFRVFCSSPRLYSAFAQVFAPFFQTSLSALSVSRRTARFVVFIRVAQVLTLYAEKSMDSLCAHSTQSGLQGLAGVSFVFRIRERRFKPFKSRISQSFQRFCTLPSWKLSMCNARSCVNRIFTFSIGLIIANSPRHT